MPYIKKMAMQGFKSFAKKTEVVFDNGINVVVGPNGSGKSCSYDTVVTLANGMEVQLGKLIEDQIKKSNEIRNLDDGIYVEGDGSVSIISLNKSSMKSEKKIVSKFIKREGDYLYKIITRSGRELKATKCHPIMSFSRGAVNSKVISELDIGSFIAAPRHIETYSDKEDAEFSRLMGYIIGDGYIASDRIEFVNNDLEILNDYENLILQYAPWGVRKRVDKNVSRIYSRDNGFYQKIRSLYETDKKTITSINKDIPNYFLSLGLKSVANLLAGLFDTDGSVRKDIGIIEYCTKNKDLSRQIQSLLLRFGIKSKIKKRMCFASNTLDKKKAAYYYLYIYGIENLKRFYENIPLRVPHKKNNLLSIASRSIKPNENIDLLPQEINVKIKELTRLLGIKVKPLKSKYPFYMAYIENRCAPSRHGVKEILPLFHQKCALLHEKYNALTLNQVNLVQFMDSMNLSAPQTAQAIGLNGQIIRAIWATQKWSAKPENLVKFRNYLIATFLARIQKIGEIITLLENLSNSDIYWDKIVSIERLDKPDFVYDLTIEDNHNFIANNIFAHNSNISDALCFALGRLSIKSMRAAKAANLLFMGTKEIKPAREAYVEIVFDNSDKTFQIPDAEITLKRIVRHNGQSIYKINEETKTRGEVIEMLAQAGIDPYGFNLILQGQIQAVVKMHPEERRKILEEVSGIAIYESRKEKSLHELEKTEERLKEISAVLRERTAFLKNLEKERSQALRYKELEKMIERCKFSIIKKRTGEKEKEIESIKKFIEEKNKLKEKIKLKIESTQKNIDSITEEINKINNHIKRSTGVERESLQEKISDLRAEIEGLKVRKESNENRYDEIKKRITQMRSSIPEHKKEIEDLRKESPLIARKQQELKKKKEELAKLEEEKNKVYSVKTELFNLRERVREKESRHVKLNYESDALLKQIEHLSLEFKAKDESECTKLITKLEKEIAKTRSDIEEIKKLDLEHVKKVSIAEAQIGAAKEIKERVASIDVCPLCRNKMTQEHLSHVIGDSESKISIARTIITESSSIISSSKEKSKVLYANLKESTDKFSEFHKELTNHRIVNEKQDYLKRLVEESKIIEKELSDLKIKRENLENKSTDASSIVEQYNTKLREIEEISSRSNENLDTTLLYKERELEKITQAITQNEEDLVELSQTIADLKSSLAEKSEMLESKEAEEEELSEKFKIMFDTRDKLQNQMQEESFNVSTIRTEITQIEDQINYLKIGFAKIDAEKQALEMDLKDVTESEPISGSLESLQERMEKAKIDLQSIGAINMRALEVYEGVKEEYERVNEKVQTLDKEKLEILKIIEEIDHKKKKTFLKTFSSVSELFSRNFSQLYTKGTAYLEMENPQDIFAGGVNIVIKMGKGKYFDVSSLSGGEQTLIALSLLFAIQEHKPYHFYIFDEIDAALDKRNSERLANLLQQYMTSGQYIIVTHNDAIILNSNLLYGVSMHDGVSKILSLQLEPDKKPQVQKPADMTQ